MFLRREAVVIMELSADKFCPCVISERLLRGAIFDLDQEFTSRATQNEVPTLSNVEVRAKRALAGNRTRAARVAGEHSTTEPPVLHES